MDYAAKTALDRLTEQVAINTRELAKLATFADVMNGHIEDSFMSAGGDFGLVAEAVAELQSDISAILTELEASSEMFCAELGAITTELTNMTFSRESNADYRKKFDIIFNRVCAIEKHLGIGDEIAA